MFPYHAKPQSISPSFSAAPLAAGCFRTGLLEGVTLSRPRVGREAMLGQKSSVLLSVWVLLSLLPVLAWALLADVAGTVGAGAAAGRAGSAGVDAGSGCSFPSSSPEDGRTAFQCRSFVQTEARVKEAQDCCIRPPIHSPNALTSADYVPDQLRGTEET